MEVAGEQAVPRRSSDAYGGDMYKVSVRCPACSAAYDPCIVIGVAACDAPAMAAMLTRPSVVRARSRVAYATGQPR